MVPDTSVFSPAAAVLNAALIVLVLLGLSRRAGGFDVRIFAFYTQLSNAGALVSSVLFLLTKGSRFSVCARYLGTCMLLMTLFVTLCILVPMGAGFKKMMFSGNCLYHHTLCPVLSFVSYVFFEPHASVWLLPTLVTLAYGIILMILNAKGKVDGPYPFFRVRHQSRKATVLWTAALFIVISGISILLSKLA